MLQKQREGRGFPGPSTLLAPEPSAEEPLVPAWVGRTAPGCVTEWVTGRGTHRQLRQSVGCRAFEIPLLWYTAPLLQTEAAASPRGAAPAETGAPHLQGHRREKAPGLSPWRHHSASFPSSLPLPLRGTAAPCPSPQEAGKCCPGPSPGTLSQMSPPQRVSAGLERCCRLCQRKRPAAGLD